MSKNASKTHKSKPAAISKKKITNGQRAGLVFPVARFETLLRRNLSGDKVCVSAQAKVALAAHSEYLFGELLNGAITRMLAEGRTTLTNTDVSDCLHQDPELRDAFQLGSLVIPSAARRRPIANGLKLRRKHPAKPAVTEGVREPVQPESE